MTASVSLVIPACDPKWFEAVGDEHLFAAAVKKAKSCEAIGPLYAAVLLETRRELDARMQQISAPITPIVLDHRPNLRPRTAVHFLKRALQSTDTEWVATLPPPEANFFDVDTFNYMYRKALEHRPQLLMNWPWPGWRIVLMHRSMLPRLEEWETLLQKPHDCTLWMLKIFNSLGNKFMMLHDEYYVDYRKRKKRPFNNNHPYFWGVGESTIEAYRTLTGTLKRRLSELDVETVSECLETCDVLAGANPSSIWVEISSVNDAPPVYFDPRQAPARAQDPPYMPMAVFERILSLAGEDPAMCRNLHLSGIGEPLQHPEYPGILQRLHAVYERDGFAGVHCYTDGRHLTEAVARELVRGAVESVMISLDAVDESNYRKVRPKGDYAAIRRNIDRLLDFKRSKPGHPLLNGPSPIIALTTTLVAELEDHIDAFMSAYTTGEAFLKKYGRSLTHDQWAEADLAYYREGHGVEHLVIAGASTYAGQNPDHRRINYTPFKRLPCRRLLKTLFIKASGDIVPCDRVLSPTPQTVVANVMEIRSLKDAWDRLAGARQAHRDGRYERAISLCVPCEDWFYPVD